MENQTLEAAVSTRTCPFCGEQISETAQKCKHCGEWLIKRYGKSWVITYLLCSFFGALGIHNFYNKKIGIGIAQLLTFGGLGIWWIIDCIMILCDCYTDADGLKLDRKPTIGGTAVFCALGFLGAAGFHRFYTKHIGLAFLQLFTLGGFGIWTLIDFIMILTGKFTDADGNLIKG